MTDTKVIALRLCQKVGMTTMFTDTNEGMSLPLEISKKIVIEMINEIAPGGYDFWNEVLEEVKAL